jgi:uncharacterized membrane protein YfcA
LGFLVLLSAVIEAVVQGFYSAFSLTVFGQVSKLLFASQDLFGILVVVSVLYALFRRFIIHPKRLQGDGHTNKDATIILLLILGVIITMFGVNSTKIIIQPENNAYYSAYFISSRIAEIFNTANPNTFHEIFWWSHIIIVLIFLNYLPYSKTFSYCHFSSKRLFINQLALRL